MVTGQLMLCHIEISFNNQEFICSYGLMKQQHVSAIKLEVFIQQWISLRPSKWLECALWAYGISCNIILGEVSMICAMFVYQEWHYCCCLLPSVLVIDFSVCFPCSRKENHEELQKQQQQQTLSESEATIHGHAASRHVEVCQWKATTAEAEGWRPGVDSSRQASGGIQIPKTTASIRCHNSWFLTSCQFTVECYFWHWLQDNIPSIVVANILPLYPEMVMNLHLFITLGLGSMVLDCW